MDFLVGPSACNLWRMQKIAREPQQVHVSLKWAVLLETPRGDVTDVMRNRH